MGLYQSPNEPMSLIFTHLYLYWMNNQASSDALHDQGKISRPGSTPIFGTLFLIEKLTSGADSTTIISLISQIK